MRCLHEAALYDASSFVTLTYSDEFCPVGLRYPDFQKFMKRLRKVFPKARFFMCGEYGEQLGRPHYHACLFGVFFKDREVWSERSDGVRLYRSALLEKLWPFGHSSVGDVSFESAGYVARYCMKKVTGDRAELHYQRVDTRSGECVQVQPEFCRMSLKPGIGYRWIEKFYKDVYGEDRDGVVVNGVRSMAPRYYDKFLEKSDPELLELLKWKREEKAALQVGEQEPERLAVREFVTKSRLSFKTRNLG